MGDTPAEAVAAFVEARGLRFAGACAAVDPATAVGAYCGELVDDRGAIQVHWIGLVGSEPEVWLLVAATQSGWAVLESAPVDDPSADPPF